MTLKAQSARRGNNMRFRDDAEYQEFLRGRSFPQVKSAPEFSAAVKVEKPSKYRNKKVVVDGVTFHSKGEFQRWQELQMMERSGAISGLQRQISYELAPSVVISGKKRPPLRYTADFVYTELGETVVEDFKNPATAAECSFRMRQHLMMSVHRIEVKVTVRKVGR